MGVSEKKLYAFIEYNKVIYFFLGHPVDRRIFLYLTLIVVPRDAAAWAAESGKLYVMGGSLGTLSGYTDNTEVYDPDTDQWSPGVSLTSTRHSCQFRERAQIFAF